VNDEAKIGYVFNDIGLKDDKVVQVIFKFNFKIRLWGSNDNKKIFICNNTSQLIIMKLHST